jgi:hypothetical protein
MILRSGIALARGFIRLLVGPDQSAAVLMALMGRLAEVLAVRVVLPVRGDVFRGFWAYA